MERLKEYVWQPKRFANCQRDIHTWLHWHRGIGEQVGECYGYGSYLCANFDSYRKPDIDNERSIFVPDLVVHQRHFLHGFRRLDWFEEYFGKPGRQPDR